MLTRFRRGAREVEAVRFDGSPASAAAISAAFSGTVAHAGDRLEVATPFGHVFAGAGLWIARERATRALSVVDPREIAAFEMID